MANGKVYVISDRASSAAIVANHLSKVGYEVHKAFSDKDVANLFQNNGYPKAAVIIPSLGEKKDERFDDALNAASILIPDSSRPRVVFYTNKGDYYNLAAVMHADIVVRPGSLDAIVSLID